MNEERQASCWLWNNNDCINDCVNNTRDCCHFEQELSRPNSWVCQNIKESSKQIRQNIFQIIQMSSIKQNLIKYFDVWQLHCQMYRRTRSTSGSLGFSLNSAREPTIFIHWISSGLAEAFEIETHYTIFLYNINQDLDFIILYVLCFDIEKSQCIGSSANI